MGKSIGSVFALFGLKSDQFKRKMADVKRTLKKTSRDMKSIGSNINTYFTAPLAVASAIALKFSTDFNQQMANVATLIPNSIGRVNELKSGIQELAVESGQSTEELTAGLYNVVSAFGDTKDSIDSIKLASKSAKAGLGTIDDAISLISATTKGYGDTSLKAQKRVADLAQTTIKYGQTTLSDLGTSIQSVTKVSNELGVSQEELFAVYSSTTGVLGNASEVSTQYASALKALLSPPKELSDIFERLNIESGKQLIQQRGLQGALQLMADEARKADIPLQKLTGRAEGMKFILALTGDQAKKFSDDLQQMKNAMGTVDEAYRQQTEGVNKVGHALKQLKQRLIVTVQVIGDSMNPVVERLIEKIDPVVAGIEDLVDWFNNLNDSTKILFGNLAIITSTIGITFSAMGTAMGGAAALTSVFLNLTKTSKTLTLTMGILSKAISVVFIALAAYELGTWLSDQFAEFKKFTVSIVSSAKILWETIKFGSKKLFDTLRYYFTDFYLFGRTLGTKLRVMLIDKLEQIAMKIKSVFGETIGSELSAPFSKLASILQEGYDPAVKKNEEYREKLKKINAKTIQDRREYLAKIAALNKETAKLFAGVDFEFENKGKPQPPKSPSKIEPPRIKFPTMPNLAASEGFPGLDDSEKDGRAGKDRKQFLDDLNKLKEKLKWAKSGVKDLSKETKDSFSSTMTEAVKDWGRTVKYQFSDMVRAGEFSFSALGKSFLNNVMSRLSSSFIDTAVSGIFGFIPGFASGGIPEIGKPALVGENGPELIIPNSPVRVLSNDTTRSVLGGNSVEIHVHQSNHFAEGAQHIADAAVVRAAPKIAEQSAYKLRDMVARREIVL